MMEAIQIEAGNCTRMAALITGDMRVRATTKGAAVMLKYGMLRAEGVTPCSACNGMLRNGVLYILAGTS